MRPRPHRTLTPPAAGEGSLCYTTNIPRFFISFRMTCTRLPSISVVLGLLGLGFAGCASTALAQTNTSSPIVSPLPTILPAASPTPAPLEAGLLTGPVATPPPLPIRPPEIVAEAGILPTSILSLLDRFSEVVDRNIFSFGIPTLRARIALTQAAERIAELQALERAGRLTPAATRGLLQAHEQLLAVADRIVAREFASGKVSPDLFFLLVRTRLAAAEVLEELKDERAVELELEGGESPSPSPRPVAFSDETSPAAFDNETEDLSGLLQEEIEHLVEFEDGMIPSGGPTVSQDVLRVLAEQKIAKAERDLLRATQKVEERLVRGKVLIADTELRASAEAALVTARQLFSAGNFAEALRLAQDARGIADRLKSGQVALEPNALRSGDAERRVERVTEQLVEHGFLGTDAKNAALLRAREAIERARGTPGVAPALPPRKEDSANLTGNAEKDESTERDERGSRDSNSGSDSSGGGSSGSGSSGRGSSGSGR